MEFFSRLLTQLSSLWERWSPAQRAGMSAALIATAAMVVGVGIWAAKPEYVLLTDRLSPQQAAECVALLESAGLHYQLSYAGTAVSVSRSDLGRARLALKDIISPVVDEGGGFSDGIWSDPTLHQARMTRQLEARLARSISQLSGVRSATVHITQGESTPFIRQRSPAKASVVLDLQPQSLFTAGDARSITSLLAHSVEKLEPQNVTVVDTNGRLLSSSEGVASDVTGQLGYRSHLEADLASKAEMILTQMLGPGRAMVRVTADVDFTKIQRKETKFDPSSKVKITETVHSESYTGAPRAAGGPAGASSNLPNDTFKAGGGNTGSKVESTETTFDNGRIEDIVDEAPGRIKRLTVAAVVQLPQSDAAGANGQTAPVITQEQVTAIIKQAVGFDASRQDQIEVLAAPLVGAVDVGVPAIAAPGWDRFAPLVRNLSLGLASIVALVLGLVLTRRMKPIVLQPEQESLPKESVLRLAELSQEARDNPEAAAQVLRSWLNQPAQETTGKAAA